MSIQESAVIARVLYRLAAQAYSGACVRVRLLRKRKEPAS